MAATLAVASLSDPRFAWPSRVCTDSRHTCPQESHGSSIRARLGTAAHLCKAFVLNQIERAGDVSSHPHEGCGDPRPRSRTRGSRAPRASAPIAGTPAHSSSLISSISHSHINLEWCDKIKLSCLMLPRKSGTIKSLQLVCTDSRHTCPQVARGMC